jgi:transcriptional regulator with XRE-family HTH domain
MAWDGTAVLGSLLRQRREAAGQTLEEAATIFGTNPTYLARLERGEAVSPPSPSILLRIAEAYHLRLDELAEAAGLSITVPSDLLWADDPALHIRFRRLAERFRPMALQPTAYEYYSAVHKAWAVSLAIAAEQFALENSPERSLRDALAARAEGTRTSEEIAQLRSDSIALMTWEGDPGFGEYLARLRQRSGRTIREIGSRMGVSHTMVANLAKQRWRRAPTRDLVERIAIAYGVDLYDLMEQAGYRSGIPTTTSCSG